MEAFVSNPDLAKLLAKVQRGDTLEAHEEIQLNFIIARVVGINAAVQAAANSGVVGQDYLEDIDTSISLFASSFNLSDRMWRYTRFAHPSVSDGQIFEKLRLAADKTKT